MGIGPPVVANRPDVDKSHLELLLRVSGWDERQHHRNHDNCRKPAADFPPHRGIHLRAPHRAVTASTRIVKANGIICNGSGGIQACRRNERWNSVPKSNAAPTARSGSQLAKMASATTIQPIPPVMPSVHEGR